MFPQLSDIKKERKKLGLTQERLAQISGVSQPLIAKTEKGKIMPAYNKARNIFEAIERLKSKETEKKAKDVMTKKVESVAQRNSLKKAAKIMEKRAYSQLPVFEKGKNIGTITEKSIILYITKYGSDISKVKVSDAMTDTMPIVNENAQAHLLSELLEHNPAVLVTRQGKIVGIISKSDLLSSII